MAAEGAGGGAAHEGFRHSSRGGATRDSRCCWCCGRQRHGDVMTNRTRSARCRSGTRKKKKRIERAHAASTLNKTVSAECGNPCAGEREMVSKQMRNITPCEPWEKHHIYISQILRPPGRFQNAKKKPSMKAQNDKVMGKLQRDTHSPRIREASGLLTIFGSNKHTGGEDLGGKLIYVVLKQKCSQHHTPEEQQGARCAGVDLGTPRGGGPARATKRSWKLPWRRVVPGRATTGPGRYATERVRRYSCSTASPEQIPQPAFMQSPYTWVRGHLYRNWKCTFVAVPGQSPRVGWAESSQTPLNTPLPLAEWPQLVALLTTHHWTKSLGIPLKSGAEKTDQIQSCRRSMTNLGAQVTLHSH